MPHDVLLVEDNRHVSVAVKEMLEWSGAFHARSAMTGIEALSALQHWRPDAAVIDATLPGMSGIELAQHVVAQDIPVLFVTGQPRARSELMALDLPFLMKPFRLKELLAAVTRIIERRSELLLQAQTALAQFDAAG